MLKSENQIRNVLGLNTKCRKANKYIQHAYSVLGLYMILIDEAGLLPVCEELQIWGWAEDTTYFVPVFGSGGAGVGKNCK